MYKTAVEKTSEKFVGFVKGETEEICDEEIKAKGYKPYGKGFRQEGTKMDRDCFNCGSTENVRWRDTKEEYYCDDCMEMEG